MNFVTYVYLLYNTSFMSLWISRCIALSSTWRLFAVRMASNVAPTSASFLWWTKTQIIFSSIMRWPAGSRWLNLPIKTIPGFSEHQSQYSATWFDYSGPVIIRLERVFGAFKIIRFNDGLQSVLGISRIVFNKATDHFHCFKCVDACSLRYEWRSVLIDDAIILQL